MTFPQTILDARIDALIGGAWANITSYVYQRDADAVVITRGYEDENSDVNPATAKMTINNRDGRFSPRNPLGPYYGQLGRNTQLRISVPEGETYLRSETDQTSGAQCPDSTGVSITGDMEVQIEVTLDSYFGASQFLAGKYDSTSNQRSWVFILNGGQLAFVWSPDGTSTNAHSAASTSGLSDSLTGRIALRATFAAATGTVTFYTGPSIAAATWTQLGSPIALGSSTSIFDSTATVTIGYNATYATVNVPGYLGKIHGFVLLSGIGGTAKASPDFTSQTAGATSFIDAQSNTWTLVGTAELSDRDYRFHGEVPAWPPRWDVTGKDVYVPIEAAGILRRLGQGEPPANSALYRAYMRATGTIAPIAYWPCEDGANATSLASAFANAVPITVAGTPTLSSNTAFDCSQAIPLLSKSVWTALPPLASSTPTVNCVKFLMQIPSTGATTNGIIASVRTTGTVARLDLVYTTGPNLTLNAYSSGGALLSTSGATAVAVNGQQMMIEILLSTSGSNVAYSATCYNIGGNSGNTVGGTTTSATVGQVVRVVFNEGALIDDTAIGHIAVSTSDDLAPYFVAGPIFAWSGEPAGIRFARLCAEDGIPYRTITDPVQTVLMGPQTAQPVLALLEECQDTDLGLIVELRQVFGLAYRTRVTMLNQSPDITLDYSLAQLADDIEPTDDDLLIRNDVTITRKGGSSARQTLTTGALSTQAPPLGVGPYPDSTQVSLAGDGQLPDEAGWALHMGTVDEQRYPTISLDLSRPEVAALFYTIQGIDLGDRVLVTNTPPWLPPDGISQLIRGATEKIGGYIYTVAWTCVPETPYRVAVFDDWVFGRMDTDGSTLASSITSGQTTGIMLATTGSASPLWTTDPADFPFDIEIGGERVTVQCPGTSRSNDPFLAAGLTHYSGQNGAIVLDSSRPFPTNADGVLAAYALQTIKLTPAGGNPSADVLSDNGPLGGIVPGQRYTAWGWVYSPTGRSMQCFINWANSSGAYLSTSFGTSTATTAGVWKLVTVTATAPANASALSVGIVDGNTPTSAQPFWSWGLNSSATSNLSQTSPQSYTCARSVNGVVKAQAAGTDVRLFQPAILSL